MFYKKYKIINKKAKRLGKKNRREFSLKAMAIQFNEILDGRVKTLHPKIHASILHDRKNKHHINSFKKLNFPIIDFVIVNLYPFEKQFSFENNNSSKVNTTSFTTFKVNKAVWYFAISCKTSSAPSTSTDVVCPFNIKIIGLF